MLQGALKKVNLHGLLADLALELFDVIGRSALPTRAAEGLGTVVAQLTLSAATSLGGKGVLGSHQFDIPQITRYPSVNGSPTNDVRSLCERYTGAEAPTES